jgi:hypothetical protein
MNSAKTANVPAAKSCAAYFFGARLALATSFFFWLAAAAFACFCAAALLVAFGDLSPIRRMLRCTATGVNSTDGNVFSGLPHRGPSERCRRTSRGVATRSPSHPRNSVQFADFFWKPNAKVGAVAYLALEAPVLISQIMHQIRSDSPRSIT